MFRTKTLFEVGAFQFPKLGRIGLLFLAFFGFNFKALSDDFQADLVLAGGALKTCSSLSPKQCENRQKIKSGKQETLYQISPAAKKRLTSTLAYTSLSEKDKLNINAVLAGEVLKNTSEGLTRNAFLDRLDEAGVQVGQDHFVRHLSDALYYAILDTFEQFQAGPRGDRLKEAVSVPDNKNTHSQAIYQTFVDRARQINQGQQPRVVVFTASSRDFFESADFYVGAMSSVGADTIWLPLSPAWQKAQQMNGLGLDGCAMLAQFHAANDLFDTRRRYPILSEQEATYCRQPEKLYELLSNAHGVFFNGGDQSKTLAALLTPDGFDSPVMSIIREKLANKTIVVGGTSAGTAVQAGGVFSGYPIPMLSNGTSKAAFERGVLFANAPSARCGETQADCDSGIRGDDLTVRSAGGTGLFSLGLMDTHFSERNREARLVMATLSSQQRFGFGVDETTALLVDYQGEYPRFKVVGAGGVFIVDLIEQQYQQRIENNRVVRQVGGQAYFLPHGASAQFSENTLSVSLPKGEMTRSVRNADDKAQWRRRLRVKCKVESPRSWQHDGLTTVIAAGENTVFSVSERDCGYTQLPFVIKN